MKDLKIHTQIIISEKPYKIDLLQDFAFFLLHRQIRNIWWKNGYFFFFNLNSNLELDRDLTKGILIRFVDSIYYYKADYKKYLITNVETQKSDLVDHIAWKTTEFAITVVFKTPNDVVDALVEEIEKRIKK